jgi:hypothetical protein
LEDNFYDPKERQLQKEKSRLDDEQKLQSGEFSREELQWINGEQGIFRNTKLIRKS